MEMGDFQVGLGRALLRPGETFLGVVVDIGYEPLSEIALAEPIIQVGRGRRRMLSWEARQDDNSI